MRLWPKHVKPLLVCCGKRCRIGPLTLSSLMYVRSHLLWGFSSFPAYLAGYKRPYTFYHFAPLGGHANIAPASPSVGACVSSGRSAAHRCLAHARLALGSATRATVIYFVKDRTGRRHKTAGGPGSQEYRDLFDAGAANAWRDGRGVYSNNKIFLNTLIMLFQNPDLVQAFFSCAESVGDRDPLSLSQSH